MNSLPPLSLQDFSEFFHAVHGYPPFPWQERLLQAVVHSGWPELLDLPTGSGKTAAIDVALFALALNAGSQRRTSALRILYVVDRRTIVDQAYDRAEKLREALSGGDGVVERVRLRLSHWTRGGTPIQTALLRGGIARDDAWAARPDQPLVAVSTVDQVGSRLLFRGYGISDSMKPVHAGLLGSDVLYLLDEVHLSQPFKETLGAVAKRYRSWADQVLDAPFTVVELSATSHDRSGVRFELDADDRRNPLLAARLRAAKPAAVVSVSRAGFLKEVQKHLMPMLRDEGATVAVVLNSVNTAREIYEHVGKVVPQGASVHLLTGRMRPFERARIEETLLPRIQADRTRSSNAQRTVVVATQTIEAGADFDFDGLVTECASLDSLRQRFGRVDRLGALNGGASGAVIARTDALEDDPVYGNAIGATLRWLQERAQNGIVDFGIEALDVPDDAGERGLLSPRVHAPVLLPSHLDAWVQTAPRPEADPDVALWLHGPQRGKADVQLVWRADLTAEMLSSAAPDSLEASEIALGVVEALPPSSQEAMAVPFLAARRWLEGRGEVAVADVEGIADEGDGTTRETAAPVPRPAVLWAGDESRVVMPSEMRPGQTFVVPSSYGGVLAGTWAPASAEPVQDVAELAAWRHRGRATIRLNPSVVEGLGLPSPPVPHAADAEDLDDRSQVRDWLASLDAEDLPPGVHELVTQLRSDKRVRVQRVPMLGENGAVAESFLVSGSQRKGTALSAADVTSESDASSFTGREMTLQGHMYGVAERAAAFAELLGLPAWIVGDLRLAGEWHDAGKADLRFQRWLHGGSEFKVVTQPEPLAKGLVVYPNRVARRRARERAGYPTGARHECTSVALMSAVESALASRANDWILVRHLVASHHGGARPLVAFAPDPTPVDVVLQTKGLTAVASSAHGLERLDSGVAERFWLAVRTYGWWGLAWLEAILRLADHLESARSRQGAQA